jgi:hypothetical protein
VIRRVIGSLALAAMLASPLPAFAGSILLTGHDVLLHDGQNGFDTVALNWLRGAGTTEEIAAANYSIAVIGSGVGFWGWSDTAGLVKPGYESTTYYDTDLMGDAEWAQALSKDVFVLLSHTSCGGCDLSTAGSAAVNARSAEIAAAFNAGMDIWANSGANLATYYDFLPPGSTTTGPPIGGSSGFVATAAGVEMGLTNTMINGHPTHNRFAGFAPAFTVFEIRPNLGIDEAITIGIRDATITDDGIVTDDGVVAPEPATLALLGLGFGAMVVRRRRT